jgi:PKD repeat protein
MSTKLNIEQLFASKLEGLEQTPSPSVWKKTARTVRRKQFFRFKPGRLNIYYLVGMVVVGAAVTYYLTAEDVGGTAEDAKENAEVVETMKDAEGTAGKDRVTAKGAKGGKVSAEDAVTAKGAERDTENVAKSAEDAEDNSKELNLTAKDTTGAGRTDSAAKDPGPGQVSSGDATGQSPDHSEDTAPKQVSTMIPYFTPTVQAGCAPLTVTFINTSVNAADYDWNVGFETNNTHLSSPVVTYTNPGTYTVTLTATDQQGITKSHATTITVYPSPMAKFEINQGNIYNYSTDAEAFAWYLVPTSPADALRAAPDPASLARQGIHPFSTGYQPSLTEVNNAHQHDDGVQLLLVATNASGCTDTAMHRLPLPALPELVFPTAFSPNPDGSIGGYYNPNHPNNQVFHPQFSEQPASYHLQVFNKAGELLFETTDIYIGWDGYYQEAPAPRGVYIYQVTGTWKNGDAYNYRGDITILRNEPY